MGGDNRARKRSGTSSTESYPVNKKAKTGVAESRNDDKKAGKKHGQVVAKKGVEKSKPVSNMSKVVIKPVKKLSPNSGKNYSGKVVNNAPKIFVSFLIVNNTSLP